jgi:uncharacterized protein YdiU (UPF0061 family)
MRQEWVKWIRRWRAALEEEGDRAGAQARMLKENPKFVPREWMLVEAYDAANKGDFAVVKQLHDLLQDPYGEGTPELSVHYIQIHIYTKYLYMYIYIHIYLIYIYIYIYII